MSNLNSKLEEDCSVGQHCGTECHKKSYTKSVKIINVETLSDVEKRLISLRSGIDAEKFINICAHHKIYFLQKFETYQTFCFDPFQTHRKRITKNLRPVTLEFSDQINNIPHILTKAIPGQKVCNSCREQYYKCRNESDVGLEIEKLPDELLDIESHLSKEEALEEINSSLVDIGESPFKFHAVPSHMKSSYAKRKLNSACSTIKSKVCKVLEQEFSPEKNMENVPKHIQQKADDLDRLVELVKEKLETPITRSQKIQLLTLAPVSWSRKKVSEEFKVSEYTVRKARELLKEKGVIALPEPRKGKVLEQATVDLVVSFYQNDEYSRIMPGKKDKVSISKNVHQQKRLLLCNLNELYAAFKFEYPAIKIGFSKFCMLRPKWCVLAGSSGTHGVCVCSIHQNVILLLQACAIENTYHELMSHLVCSMDNRDCMLRHCSNCPTSENLKKFLEQKFEEWDQEDEVTYNAWVTTDRTQQVTLTVSLEEYLNHLIKSLEKLLPHSFITKSQSNYLKELKSTLKPEEAIVLIDFSENYSYVIQDEVQGYHWTQDSCSLHPVVIYTCDELSNLTVSSLCVVSDDLEHDVAFVHETQRIVVEFLKVKFPQVESLHYFSDGCAGQYKNCKNFLNLCNHQQDFNIKACWSFFATSHGKSPCDGIGGTVKRLLTRESLQTGSKNVITSVERVMEFCQSRIEKISFYLLRKEHLSVCRQNLESRFSQAKTVPGTRSFHCFLPQSETVIATKRISSDTKHSMMFDFCGGKAVRPEERLNMTQICTNSYVACVYDDHWFFGLILSKDEEECDVEIKFMHPFGPSTSFHWPYQKDDICFVPLQNIIRVVDPPTTKGSGRVYYFPDIVVQEVDLKFKNL